MAADTSWTLDPGPIAAVAIVGVAYVRRWRSARQQAGPRAAPGWRLASFVAGLLVVLVALVSPIDSLAHQLFVMHMLQHVLLLDVAPILLILGLTKVILRPVTRRLQRLEQAAGPIGHPAFAVVAYVVVMWAWHAPALYDAALRHPLVHVLEHICFASVGLLYWWHLLSPIRSRLRLSGMAPVVYMLATKLFVGLLGIGLSFAPDSLYSFYAHQPRVWGLAAGEDQAIAGLLMALEQSLIMGIALAWLFARMLGESEREDQRTERFA